jgi:hypothetical protein
MVNLDHILLLRLNALCMKIAVVAMLVYVTICLPIYFYAQCSEVPLGEVDMSQSCSNITLSANVTFSSYSRFTLANVPDLQTGNADYHLASFKLYLVSMSTWLVCWYACFGEDSCALEIYLKSGRRGVVGTVCAATNHPGYLCLIQIACCVCVDECILSICLLHSIRPLAHTH